MKKIIWKRPDGGVSITVPCEPMSESETEQEYLDRIAAKLREKHPDANGNLSPSIPAAWVRVADIPEGNIPADRTFRNAWTWTTPEPVVDIDMAKAKEITKNRLRAERKPLLEALDVQVMRAQEAGADTSSLIAEKKRLRDITKLADNATTLDALKALKLQK